MTQPVSTSTSTSTSTSPSRYCTRCNKRWRQSFSGLCRRCERITLNEAISDQDRKERIEERQYHQPAPRGGRMVPARELEPRQAKTTKIGQEEFEVVWDGT